MRRFDCTDEAARQEGLATAATAVGRGDLVVLPTDTVYGIGANAFDATAVRALLATKGRGRDMPVPVLIGSWRTLDGLVAETNVTVRELTRAFWPGGLTVIVRQAPSLRWDLGDARGTVAVRMPLHPVAIDLLGRTGPMAVSSANRTGQPAATTADEAIAQFDAQVDVYLDAGPATAGVASTIVDCTGLVPKVVRVGAISVTDLRAVLPIVEAPDGVAP
jgi:tRNA threonylcarbamoyl adenosine modification protein (Sua5/YciO/YrdC/YwlC family)